MRELVKITFNNEEIEVKKIKIRNIGALAQTLKGLPELFQDFLGNSDEIELNTQKLLEIAPNLIMQAGDTVPQFLSVAADIDLETVLDGGLDDLIVLIQAVLSVNNFETIVGYLKNLRGNQN